MGLIRIALALAVLFSHMPQAGVQFLGGALAVQCFFIVSGFYMALVLDGKYRDLGLFYSNRVLRLAPTYLVVLAASAMFVFALGGDGEDYAPMMFERVFAQPGIALIMLFENLFLVGQEMLFWFSVDATGHFVLDTSGPVPVDGVVVGWQGLLVPQAWSISMELVFYAVAPFVLRLDRRWIAVIALISIGIRFVGLLLPVDYLLWQGRLFPTALFLFLLGSLGFKALPLFYRLPLWTGWVACAALLVAMGAFLNVGLPLPQSRWIMYFAVAVATPLIFRASHRFAWDRWMGNLSYPFYLVHLVVLIALGTYVPDAPIWLPVVITLALSCALMIMVDMPVDRWRQRRVRAAAQPVSQPLASVETVYI